MATTVLRTVYPIDRFDSEVAGAPLITRDGVAVDNTLLAAVLAAASTAQVAILQGGVAGGSPVADATSTLNGSISYAGPPVTGTWQVRQIVVDSNSAAWVCTAAGSPGSWQPLGSATYGPGSDQWLQAVGGGFNFAFATVTSTDSSTGLPTAGTVRWPDGTGGNFTGAIDGGGNGYSSYTVTWAGTTTKTLTATGITYDANGIALGPTGLAVS